MDPPAFRQDLRFFERVEQLAVQQLLPHLAIKGFDIAVLPGGPWLDIERRHVEMFSQCLSVMAMNSGPLSERICVGIPRLRNRSARIKSTSCERIRRATTEATHSRVYASSIFKIRNGRPSCVRSATKSYDHTWLGRSGRWRTQDPLASQRRARLGCFCGTGRPSCRQIVDTRSFPTLQPSCLTRSVTVLYP